MYGRTICNGSALTSDTLVFSELGFVGRFMVQSDLAGILSSTFGFRGRGRRRGVVCEKLCFTKKVRQCVLFI